MPPIQVKKVKAASGFLLARFDQFALVDLEGALNPAIKFRPNGKEDGLRCDAVLDGKKSEEMFPGYLFQRCGTKEKTLRILVESCLVQRFVVSRAPTCDRPVKSL